MSFSKILLCVDGEPHTEAALTIAVGLAREHGAQLDAIYVVDPFLQKFTHEIYAVNRDECRAHLDRSLAAEGEAALAEFAQRAAEQGLRVGQLLHRGPPEEVIPHVASDGAYQLVVLGGKRFQGRLARWTSRDLPSRLEGRLGVSVLLARV
ncbi:MAG TPA: universal stress protein [Rhodocyclaceae bacterium]